MLQNHVVHQRSNVMFFSTCSFIITWLICCVSAPIAALDQPVSCFAGVSPDFVLHPEDEVWFRVDQGPQVLQIGVWEPGRVVLDLSELGQEWLGREVHLLGRGCEEPDEERGSIFFDCSAGHWVIEVRAPGVYFLQIEVDGPSGSLEEYFLKSGFVPTPQNHEGEVEEEDEDEIDIHPMQPLECAVNWK